MQRSERLSCENVTSLTFFNRLKTTHHFYSETKMLRCKLVNQASSLISRFNCGVGKLSVARRHSQDVEVKHLQSAELLEINILVSLVATGQV